MKRFLLAAFAAFTIGGAALATAPVPLCSGDCMVEHRETLNPSLKQMLEPRIILAQDKTTTVTTEAPVTATTTVKGGNLAAEVIQWIQVALVPTIGAVVLAVLYRVFGYFGIQTTEMQRAQLQGIIVNGLNSAAAKAQVSLRASDKLDYTSKSAIVNDAIAYAQAHGAETIKALGLDPESGDAVSAIRARIETALNDPATPTPPVITPTTGGGAAQPLAPGHA